MKPVIKSWPFGFPWQCVGSGVVGVGITPKDAYFDWVATAERNGKRAVEMKNAPKGVLLDYAARRWRCIRMLVAARVGPVT